MSRSVQGANHHDTEARHPLRPTPGKRRTVAGGVSHVADCWGGSGPADVAFRSVPGSSKTTDIPRDCGISRVQRVAAVRESRIRPRSSVGYVTRTRTLRARPVRQRNV